MYKIYHSNAMKYFGNVSKIVKNKGILFLFVFFALVITTFAFFKLRPAREGLTNKKDDKEDKEGLVEDKKEDKKGGKENFKEGSTGRHTTTPTKK